VTDIFVCFHDTITNYSDKVTYLKLNSQYINRYEYSNIVLQPEDLQWTQPYLSEFTGFKMIEQLGLNNSDWIATLQYDHLISESDIEFINNNDCILVFNPFGNGLNALRDQDYTIENNNFIDFSLDRYNQYFSTDYKYSDLQNIPFPSCSSVKISKQQFDKIMKFILSNKLNEILSLGSSLYFIHRWPAHLFERMFAISVMIEILEGSEYKIYQIEHHA
jgi:hypothetical protein